MAIDKVVDSTKLNNALDYSADRIRLKTGLSADIPFDYQGETGFGAAIDAIPTGTEIDETISGSATLVLLNAKEAPLKSLVRTGVVEQTGTPSPSTPAPLTINNGVLGAVDDELPAGYRRVKDIIFDGTAYYDTGKKMVGSDVVTMTLDNTSTTGQNVFGSYSGTASGNKNFSLFIYGGGSTSQSYLRYNETLYRPRFGSGKRTISFGAGGTDGFAVDVTISETSFTSTANALIGALPNSSSPKFTGTIVGTITVGSRLKYVPCVRLSDSAVGYYEMVNGEFLAPEAGTPTFSGYDGSHLVPAVIGTNEVITLSATGETDQTATVANLFAAGEYIDNQDILGGTVTRKCGYKVFTGAESVSASGTGWSTGITDKLKSKAEVICSHYPYSSATMANAPDKSIIAFASVNIGFKDSSFSTAQDVKDFFKDQLEAGTPVVVVYPLDEEVEETVTAQPLNLVEGTNTISSVANTTQIPMEAEYTLDGIPLQTVNITPGTTAQTVTPAPGYVGIGEANVAAVPQGTEGTPTATKGAVSNHAITVTPSVTNVGGVIEGGTHTGQGVSVTAQEVTSGTLNITSNNEYNVTNYRSVSVSVPASAPENAYSIEACQLLYYDGNEQQGSLPWGWSFYDDIGIDATHNVAIVYQYEAMDDPFYILPYLQYTGGAQQSYVIDGYDSDREVSYKQLGFSYYDYSVLDSDIILKIYEDGGIVLENSYDPDITTSAYTVYLTSEYKAEVEPV